MSINNKRGNNEPSQEQGPSFDASQVHQEPLRQSIHGKGGLNALLGRRLNRMGGNEDVSKIVETMRSHLRSELNDDKLMPQFVIVDSTTAELAVSVIAVASRLTVRGVQTVLAYPILVEPRDRSMDTTRTVRESNRELTLPVVTSDFYDDRTRTAIDSAIARSFNLGADANIQQIGFCVLPTEVSADDSDRLSFLATNIYTAVETWIKEQPGNAEPRLNLADIDPRQTRFTGKLDFSPAPLQTLTNLPVRNDITISTKMRDVSAGESLHSQTGILTEVSGYIDLMYVEPQLVQHPITQQPYLAPACYMPNFIITHQEIMLNAVTPELVLFGLASTRLLSQGNAFFNAFKPRHGVKNDVRDIGAIGYEVDLVGDGKGIKAPIDTNESTFNLQQLLQQAFRPGLLYSLDIPDGGEYSWVYDAFIYAANGDKNAEGDIIQYADNLTNGHFRPMWNQLGAGIPVAVDTGDLIPLGYLYAPETEQRQDLRNIDYLAMLNLYAGSDMKQVIEWSETYSNPSLSPQQRLDTRVRMLKAMLSQNLHIKQLARRITLTGAFIDTLANAVNAAGVVIAPETVFSEQNHQVRGNSALAGMAVQSGVSPLFANNSQPTVLGYNSVYRPRGTGRFGS